MENLRDVFLNFPFTTLPRRKLDQTLLLAPLLPQPHRDGVLSSCISRTGRPCTIFALFPNYSQNCLCENILYSSNEK